jgi:hypothetical protein
MATFFNNKKTPTRLIVEVDGVKQTAVLPAGSDTAHTAGNKTQVKVLGTNGELINAELPKGMPNGKNWSSW